MNHPARLAIVSPCYNESEILENSISKLKEKLIQLINENLISNDSFILIVDDGSTDNSWEIIKRNADNFLKGIKLTKNFGHQYALWAGMEYVFNKCDICITIDVDLQDDLDVLPLMINKWYEGYDIIFGVKKKRNVDNFFKRFTAIIYYKIMRLLGVDLIYNHADFRLLSKNALDLLLKFEERNLFLRGLVTTIGLKTTVIYYDIKDRPGGRSKYNFKKMLSFAWEGITSFTTFPLKIVTVLGLIIFLFSFFMGCYALYAALFTNKTVPGWASIIIAVYFLGGIQIFAIGILGEYIGKIYREVKRRPRYLIEEEV